MFSKQHFTGVYNTPKSPGVAMLYMDKLYERIKSV